MAKRWKVVYHAMSDGRLIEIHCSNKKEAEAFRDMVQRVDSKANPQIEEET